MNKSRTLPKKILVYQCDKVDGVPIYAVANNVDEIPEEFNGRRVGNYTLNQQSVFRVRRELK